MLSRAVLPSTCTAGALIVLLLATSARAQAPTGWIQGRVTSAQTDEPINAVQVIVEGTKLGNITDDRGHFTIEVPAGVYSVRAQSIGYRTIVISEQRVLAGQTLTLNFRLEQTAVEVEPVIVTGDVSLYRFWRPPHFTVVEGLFRVDGEMLAPGGHCRYTVHAVVFDSMGVPLVASQRPGRCAPPSVGGTTGALETFQFALAPGRYTIEVTASLEGRAPRAVHKRIAFESLTSPAIVSDLILGSGTGWLDADREDDWLLKKGRIGIQASSEVVADERDSTIGYYLEVYATPRSSMTGRLVAVIHRPDGGEVSRLVLQKLNAVTDTRPLAGNFSVAGLPPGQYELEARLELRGRVITRTHRFRIARSDDGPHN
jgi:hypothetical protein